MNNKNRSFPIAFSSIGCPHNSLQELCLICRQSTVFNVEIRALESELDLPKFLQSKFLSPEKWAETVHSEGINVCGLSSSLKLVGNKPQDREDFLRFIPWAEALGGAPLRVFDGGDVETGLPARALREALETIAWWRELKAANGWSTDIIIETHDALAHRESVQRLQHHLKTPVDILWDTHHTWKKGGEDIPATWSAIGQWVRHIHIKDSISVPSARHPFTYVLPGTGEFPLQETLQYLVQQKFGGMVSLEWEKLWHPYLGPLEDALKAMEGIYNAL